MSFPHECNWSIWESVFYFLSTETFGHFTDISSSSKGLRVSPLVSPSEVTWLFWINCQCSWGKAKVQDTYDWWCVRVMQGCLQIENYPREALMRHVRCDPGSIWRTCCLYLHNLSCLLLAGLSSLSKKWSVIKWSNQNSIDRGKKGFIATERLWAIGNIWFLQSLKELCTKFSLLVVRTKQFFLLSFFRH